MYYCLRTLLLVYKQCCGDNCMGVMYHHWLGVILLLARTMLDRPQPIRLRGLSEKCWWAITYLVTCVSWLIIIPCLVISIISYSIITRCYLQTMADCGNHYMAVIQALTGCDYIGRKEDVWWAITFQDTCVSWLVVLYLSVPITITRQSAVIQPLAGWGYDNHEKYVRYTVANGISEYLRVGTPGLLLLTFGVTQSFNMVHVSLGYELIYIDMMVSTF